MDDVTSPGPTDLNEALDQIGDQAETISGLRVVAYEADDVKVPALLLQLPKEIDYLSSYGPGALPFKIEATILISLVNARIRRREVLEYANPTGDKSLKAVLEAGTYPAFDSLAVHSGRFTVVTIANKKYLAAVFSIDIFGRGQ